MFAAEIRRKRIDRMRAYSNWKWYLDEVFVKINGETGLVRGNLVEAGRAVAQP